MSLLTKSKTNKRTYKLTKKPVTKTELDPALLQLKSRQKHSTAILTIFFKMQIKLTEVNKNFIHLQVVELLVLFLSIDYILKLDNM